MPRILVLVADPDLSAAVAAALADCGVLRAPDASTVMPARGALRAEDWDVCVADATVAAEATALRGRRGLVLLATIPRLIPGAVTGTMTAAAVVLPIPCSLARLRDAVGTVATASGAA
jgi:uncharacterized membrane protein (DUF441 family)